LYSCDVTNFHQKLKIRATKVSKEDFYLVDIDPVPNLIQNNLDIIIQSLAKDERSSLFVLSISDKEKPFYNFETRKIKRVSTRLYCDGDADGSNPGRDQPSFVHLRSSLVLREKVSLLGCYGTG
jgi:hypothetical protein